MILNIIKYIYENNLLNKNGIIMCEYEDEILKENLFTLLKHKKYGSKNVSIYINS